MIAKVRNIPTQFGKTCTAKFQNLLVSGCSFTYNNSEQHACSWPYYLRDLAGFQQVFDCSQSGAGTNHIFNSVINETETNHQLDATNTLVIVMWSGLTRTDVIAEQQITGDYHHMSNYNFDHRFATLSIFNQTGEDDPIDLMAKKYKMLVDTDAQIYESLLKIIALHNYLKNKNYQFVFLSWKDPRPDFDSINTPLTGKVEQLLDPVEPIDSYADARGLKLNDGHPDPNGHLEWTRNCLIPYLQNQKFVNIP